MKAIKIIIAAIASVIAAMIFGGIVMAAVSASVAFPVVIMVGIICSIATVGIIFAIFAEAIEE